MQPPELQLSTTVLPINPTYGMPQTQIGGGSGQPQLGSEPLYIRGLEPYGYQDFSGPYPADSDSSSTDEEDLNPRRRRMRSKEPVGRDVCPQPRGSRGTIPRTVEEIIKAHEAEILKLKNDLENCQTQPRGQG